MGLHIALLLIAAVAGDEFSIDFASKILISHTGM
jgi:hypothetical protein